MTQFTLKSFVDNIFGINPGYIDVFGAGLPGMAGASAATSGAQNSGTELINDLRKDTAAFAELVANNGDEIAVSAAAGKVEGQLLMLEAMRSITTEACEALVDQLHSLTSK